MWHVGFYYVVALAVTAVTLLWTYKWRNPTCKGRGTRLPPGSMGLPIIGETLQFFVPSKSLDIQPFVKSRIKKYGPVFKTSLVGRPVIVSSDAEFNNFIFQQEGKLVELWYMDSFSKLLGEGVSVTGHSHKHLKRMVTEHFGPAKLKEKLLPELEQMASRALLSWTDQESVEMKRACSTMILNFTSKQLFGYDPEKSRENLSELYFNFIQGLMSIPLNVPGTAFHKCLQKQKRILQIMKEIIEERRDEAACGKFETERYDFLDHLKDEMKEQSFITYDFIPYIMFALMFATVETIPATLTLAVKFLTEHPSVLEELVREHEEIIQKRADKKAGLTWDEYKSMTFTMHVINESLRMASVAAGILRRTTKDIHMNGYMIPQGWTIMVVPSAIHLNPATYKDPLEFNPYRWKELGPNVKAKNFIPFGGGMRTCAGAEFSKVLMAVFLHVLVTKHRWTKVKEDRISRSPVLDFGSGYYINVSNK